MAKKKKGYYSPQAFQARAQANAVRLEQETQPAQEAFKTDLTQIGTGATQTQVKPIDVSSVFTPAPSGLDWDYKTAVTDMQGNPLQTRNFLGRSITPRGFDPNGNPYFGEGVSAWLQKWAYKITEESATKGETADAWKKFGETSSQFSANFLGGATDFLGGTVEKGAQISAPSEERKAKAKEQGALFLQGTSELWDASTKWIESQEISGGSAATGAFKSPVTYALRLTNAAVGMTLELFQEISELPEKSGGAQRAMREYATEHGSILPELTFDPVGDEYLERIENDPKLKSMYAPENGFRANEEAADFMSRLAVPLLAGYDVLRFLTSPGTGEEKKQAVQRGWIEGRMLYTELLKDSVRNEYIQRVKAGEDPALLVMELEDPWIEAGGEILLDPLNFLGFFGKAKKFGNLVNEAEQVVEHTGLLNKAEFANEIKNLSNLGNADGVETGRKLARMIDEESTLQARRIASIQGHGVFSFIPSANKIRERKVMGNYVTAITQAIRNTGGSPDDVLDYVNAIRKLNSHDEVQILDGMATISKMPVQYMAYNDAAFEVGYMLNNILSEGDIAAKMKGMNAGELATYLDKVITKATDYAFPSVSEMQKADVEYKKLIETAGDVNVNTVRKAMKEVKGIDSTVSNLRENVKKLRNLKGITASDLAGEASRLKAKVTNAISERNKALKALDNELVDLKTQATAFKMSKDGNLQFTNIIDDIRKSIESLYETKKMSKAQLSGDVNTAREVAKNMSEFQKAEIQKITDSINALQSQISSLRGQRTAIADSLAQIKFGDSTVGDFVRKLDNQERLAEAFKVLKKEHPGYVKWAQFQDLAEATLKPINGFLANNYFSLSYGYAARNALQNMFTLWVDGGLVWDNVGLASTNKLDSIILRLNGGQMPEMFQHSKTFLADTTEGSLFKRTFGWLNSKKWSPAQLAQAGEIYAGKMIYVNKYRSTMDSVATFGGMFPELSKWKEAGYSAEQAQDFIDLFRANDYDELATFEAYARKYGDGSVDAWRVLDWVNPEAKKGLQEYGSYWDEIIEYVNKSENPTQRDVLDFIDTLKQRAKKDALKAIDEPARINDADPFAQRLMDDAELAGEYGNKDLDNALLHQKIQAENALGEFVNALEEAKIGISQTNPDLARRINAEIQAIEPLKKETITLNDQLQRWVRNKSKKAVSGINPADLWDEAIMGPKPKSGIITKESFLQHLWQNVYYPKRSKMWNKYFNQRLSALQEIAKSNDLIPVFDKANYEAVKLQEYANYIYNDGKAYTKPPVLVRSVVGETSNANNIRTLSKTYGQMAPSNSGIKPDDYIKNIINKYSKDNYTRLEDIPLDVAEKALAQHSGHTVKYFVKKVDDVTFESNNLLEGLPVPPPRDPTTSPFGHVYSETKDGLLGALNHIQNGIRDRWGLRMNANSDADGLLRLIPDLSERVAIAKSKSQIVAEKFRDFALLPYGEKTNFDLAMSLVYPYQFWYSRSYKNWMTRAFMTNPEIISRYANVKDAMANEQKDLPDWWKSQLNVSKVLGIETDNPMYINLEAAVNPLYGLTGVDFNNPKKRVDWWSSTLDDMGKFGPSIFAPLQIATALYYYGKGEKEVASYWGGRVIPLTGTFKAVSSYFGTPVELDPAVQFFNGGLMNFGAMDSYEEGRVSRALSSMKAEGVPEEALIEAARTHEGDLWNEAYQRATQARAGGQLMSFMFGVGFKGRSKSDMEIDRFYADYERMKNLRDAGYMTPDQYRQAFNDMREAYPFMDIILLSRRAGDGREAAYAYNVLSRIPPGYSSAIFEAADVDYETASKFYESGGQFGDMTETERQHFYASMVDIGAMLKIPSNTTREEWTAVRARYNQINQMMKDQYGEDILDRISDFYALTNQTERDAFESANPEVMQAMDEKTAFLANDPVMTRYYGGIDVIERYYTSQMYDKLEATYSEETLAKVQLYYDMTSSEKAKFKKQNPDLAAYFKDKYAMQDDIVRRLSEFGEILPVRPELQDVEPAYAKQEDIAQAVVPEPQISYDQWLSIVGEPTMQLIEDFQNGEDLPYSARQRLEYIAEDLGFEDDEDVLVAILRSMP